MVIPIYDNNPFAFRSPPYVNWSLIAINIAIFAYTVSISVSGSNEDASILALAFTPGLIGHHDVILPGSVPWEFTLVTYSFFHASWLHVIGNMAFLWVFGDDVEEALGHLRYLVFYLLCAAAGAIAYWLSDPNSTVPLVGASGAIAGVVGAYLLLHPCRKIWVLAFMRIPLHLAAEWVIGFWIVLQFVNIFAGADKQVAWWTHIGGLTAGVLLVVVMRQPGVKLFDCGADRLLEKQNTPTLKRWPKRVDT
ncbi:MAG TPA: rhomboid family intramembrane serine protease [Xanthobacteraceae bacterium]|nr:rhomboid family intramembrane serine protease [Xanthobacteraceae bacterium]